MGFFDNGSWQSVNFKEDSDFFGDGLNHLCKEFFLFTEALKMAILNHAKLTDFSSILETHSEDLLRTLLTNEDTGCQANVSLPCGLIHLIA